MQPLELLASTKAAMPEAPDKSGPPATHDNFGRLMDDALAPKNHSKPGNSRSEKPRNVAAGNTSQPDSQRRSNAVDASEKKPDGITTAESGDTARKPAGKKPETDEQISAETLAQAAAGQLSGAEPEPVFLTLPITVHVQSGQSEMPVPVKTGKIPAGNTPPLISASAPPNRLLTTLAADRSPAETLATANSPAAEATEKLTPAIMPESAASPATRLALKNNGQQTKPLIPTAGANATQISIPAESGKTPAAALTETLMATDTPADSVTPSQLEADASKAGGTIPVDAKVSQHRVETGGTGVATTVATMKNGQNENKVAGLDVKVLPGGTNDSVREHPLPAAATAGPVRAQDNQKSEPAPLWLPTVEAPKGMEESQNLVSLPSLNEVQLKNLERTHDLVSAHAVRLVESKSDSMQVVIKPGAGTELSLELKHRNGGVEVAAVLQRGDYQWLNQHWPELQQRLEQRGIRLAALESDGSFGSAGNPDFSQQQSRREEQAQQASAFAEFTVAMSRGGATARLAPVTAGGWESWA